MNKKEHKSTYCSTCESDTKEAHFVRNIKNIYGKYKGKLPFNCFNCGKVRHFATKCPYEKNESSDDEKYHNVKKGSKHYQNNHKQDKHERKKNSYNKKKGLYSNEVSDLSKEGSESIFDGDRE